MNLWDYFWYMISLETSNEEVFFLKVELDISIFIKSYDLKNSKFIWIYKKLDEVWVCADCISDWVPLSILGISWAKDIQIRWLKILWKYKTITYNFHEYTEGWIDHLYSPKSADIQCISRAHVTTGICTIPIGTCLVTIGTCPEFWILTVIFLSPDWDMLYPDRDMLKRQTNHP